MNSHPQHNTISVMSVTTKKKHVERELFEDFSLPEENQSIVRIVRSRGNNLHQVSSFAALVCVLLYEEFCHFSINLCSFSIYITGCMYLITCVY